MSLHPLFIRGARVVALYSLSSYCALALAAETPLTLERAEQLAIFQAPGLAQHRNHVQVAAERTVSEGQLPDPQLIVGAINVPTDTFDLSQDDMTMTTIGVRQAFPPGATRALRTQRAGHNLTRAQALLELERRSLVRNVRHTWLELYYLSAARRQIDSLRPLSERQRQAAEGRYRAAQDSQQAVLQARQALARLTDREYALRAQQRRAQAMLARWIGVPVEEPLRTPGEPMDGRGRALSGTGAGESMDGRGRALSGTGAGMAQVLETQEQFPMPATLPELPALPEHFDAEQHPEWRASHADYDSAHTDIDLARQEYKSGMTVDLSYGLRRPTPDGRERANMLTALVTVDLPLFRAKRQDRRVAEKQAMEAGAQYDVEDKTRDLQAQYAMLRADHEALTQRVQLYTQQIVPNARREASVSVAGNARDQTLLREAQIKAVETELELTRLRVDLARNQVDLLYLTGGAQP